MPPKAGRRSKNSRRLDALDARDDKRERERKDVVRARKSDAPSLTTALAAAYVPSYASVDRRPKEAFYCDLDMRKYCELTKDSFPDQWPAVSDRWPGKRVFVVVLAIAKTRADHEHQSWPSVDDPVDLVDFGTQPPTTRVLLVEDTVFLPRHSTGLVIGELLQSN